MPDITNLVGQDVSDETKRQVLAGFLSTIDFTPSIRHPDEMLKWADDVLAITKELHNNVIRTLATDDVMEIHRKIIFRQDKFKEDLLMSIGVVLLNYGDNMVKVRCVNGEFEGTKGDLTPRDGVPLCPNGHPLFEISEAPKLALINKE